MIKTILTGTSGYSYSHWKEVFYPRDIPQSKWLEFYVQHFNCLELNVTFYRLPQKKAFKSWYRRTPEGFKFVLKGSRFITHIKRLKDCGEALKTFFDRARELKEKLICILWQLPPSLKFDCQRIEDFAGYLKNNYKNCLQSFEFRNETWFQDSTYSILKANNFNLCIADSPDYPCREVLTSNFAYLRFHGGKKLYTSEYSKDELELWAEKIKKWPKKLKLLFAFFNNDASGFAIKNARQFRKILDERL